jgi:hypothetical protein
MEMTTWRKEIVDAMEEVYDSWDNVVGCTLSDGELDVEFNADFGTVEGQAFMLWTKSRVYFPVVYDGSEWVSSVPRNPCEEKKQHVGGQ